MRVFYENKDNPYMYNEHTNSHKKWSEKWYSKNKRNWIVEERDINDRKYVTLTNNMFQNYAKKQNITLQVRTAVSPSSTRRGWAPVDTRGKSANIALLHLAQLAV